MGEGEGEGKLIIIIPHPHPQDKTKEVFSFFGAITTFELKNFIRNIAYTVRVKNHKELTNEVRVFSGPGPKILRRPGPGRVRVQENLICRIRVRVRKFSDLTASSLPNALSSTVIIILLNFQAIPMYLPTTLNYGILI